MFQVLLCDKVVKARKVALLKIFEPLLNSFQGSEKVVIVEAQPQSKHSQGSVLKILASRCGALMKEIFNVGRQVKGNGHSGP